MSVRQCDFLGKIGIKTVKEMKGSISIIPSNWDINPFVDRFAKCFVDGSFEVSEFRWWKLLRWQINIVIFHWPNEFFSYKANKKTIYILIKLTFIVVARFLYGTRFVWVAHDIAPPDGGANTPLRLALFLRCLNGIIFLSKYSRAEINKTYPVTQRIPALITRHGHYCELIKTPATVRHIPSSYLLRLVFFGQIRPYKNIERLIECVAEEIGVELLVVGMGKDMELNLRLEQLAKKSDNVRLDIRSSTLPDVDLEKAIDFGDAVVLPYQGILNSPCQNILNSGSVFLALSRNRPVLAPFTGSLPELQQHVGPGWLSLYEGSLTSRVIRDFHLNLQRLSRAEKPDLLAYDWKDIGRELCTFVENL